MDSSAGNSHCSEPTFPDTVWLRFGYCLKNLQRNAAHAPVLTDKCSSCPLQRSTFLQQCGGISFAF